MSKYLTVFQYEDPDVKVNKFPVTLDVLSGVPEIGDAFTLGGNKSRIWEVKKVTQYLPMIVKYAKALSFKSICVCQIGQIDLPRSYWDLDLVNIDIPKSMPTISYKTEKDTPKLIEVPFFKSGVIRSGETELILTIET